ncbi:MAG: sugar phosphate isomerase/epimerase [Spirochaetota bacterium]|nr:MAG: sugar phosphate isomerase/epimerase [Spirochaetota bacterium]
MKVGVSSYTWAWAVGRRGYEPEQPMDTFGLLEKTKQNKIKVLQLADNISLHKMNKKELKKISDAAQNHGIEIELGTKGMEPEKLLQYLSIAKQLGSIIVRTITHRLDREAVSWIREVLPLYQEAGVSIAVENHDEHSTDELVAFIESVGSAYVGVCLDTVNSFAALESPEDVVKNLAPYTINIHIKDFDIERADHMLGFSIVGKPAGEGRLDIVKIINYLKKYGREPNAILELWTPYTGSIGETIIKEDEWAKRSIRYLKKVFM